MVLSRHTSVNVASNPNPCPYRASCHRKGFSPDFGLAHGCDRAFGVGNPCPSDRSKRRLSPRDRTSCHRPRPPIRQARGHQRSRPPTHLQPSHRSSQARHRCSHDVLCRGQLRRAHANRPCREPCSVGSRSPPWTWSTEDGATKKMDEKCRRITSCDALQNVNCRNRWRTRSLGNTPDRSGTPLVRRVLSAKKKDEVKILPYSTRLNLPSICCATKNKPARAQYACVAGKFDIFELAFREYFAGD